MSNLNSFMDVADQLGDYYKTRRNIQIQLSHAEEDHELRALAITPKGGWLSDQPKSNAEQREAERKRVFAADETLQKIAAIQRDLRDQLSDISAKIEALEEIRDSMKWTVRQSLAESMNGKAITFTEHSVVEDAAEAHLEESLWQEDVEPVRANGGSPNGDTHAVDDIPF